MNAPAVPASTVEALSRFPSSVRIRLMQIRTMIFAAAVEEGVSPLTESLKWGEPAYRNEAGRSGTTIRLGVVRSAPKDCAVLFNCKTTLVCSFRMHFADEFTFEGNRALIMPSTKPLPRDPLMLCLRAALTYRRKGTTGTPRQFAHFL
ncbi:DUF1801 domain-containing protein [Mesorhizobium sp. NBSH29]|nr:DUF1801 domain-containing protein [Mesorhizobium sp. NBSH29]